MRIRRRHRTAVAVLLGLSILTASRAVALEPTKPSQIVTGLAVAFGGLTSPPCPGIPNSAIVNILANPDGTSGVFAIPPKSVLVVTSFDYSIATTPSIPDFVTITAINPGSLPAEGGVPNLTFSGGIAGTNGQLVGSATVPGGFIVKPPAILCAQGGSGFQNALVAVHGFFTKDK
jgi:hypothetical protein